MRFILLSSPFSPLWPLSFFISVGIMEGLEAIRFWDRDLKAIKVLRNFTFSENGELKELEVMEIPGLAAEIGLLQCLKPFRMLKPPQNHKFKLPLIHLHKHYEPGIPKLTTEN